MAFVSRQPRNLVLSPLRHHSAVTLASFEASAAGSTTCWSTWETVSELDNAGFNLYRGTSPAAPDSNSTTH